MSATRDGTRSSRCSGTRWPSARRSTRPATSWTASWGGIQAAAANRTSEIARVLTVVSSIMLPLTLIAGIYGMNFESMPELKWPLGYPAVLSVMAVVGLGSVGVFWRLGWLGGISALRSGKRKETTSSL